MRIRVKLEDVRWTSGKPDNVYTVDMRQVHDEAARVAATGGVLSFTTSDHQLVAALRAADGFYLELINTADLSATQHDPKCSLVIKAIDAEAVLREFEKHAGNHPEAPGANAFEGKSDARQMEGISAPVSRFRHAYRALTAPEKAIYDAIKLHAEDMETLFNKIKAGRELALAMTKLEEAVMWAIKALTK